MPLSSDRLLAALRAIGEQTRLRIVALLALGELTVSDLVDILGHSQPRISRHLKLLADAGVVTKSREGNWIFVTLGNDPAIRDLVATIVDPIDDDLHRDDRHRRQLVLQRRAAAAQEYFARIAPIWDQERSLHAPDTIVEAAIVATANQQHYRRVLDLGTGTGRMLQLLAADPTRIDRGVGLDDHHAMLAVARSNLEHSGLTHLELRQGDVYTPPFRPSEFDLVVIHQVLHFLDDPARAIKEAARLLAPGGRLLIVDFAPHQLEFLRTDHAHRRLGFPADQVEEWLRGAGLDPSPTNTIDARPASPTPTLDTDATPTAPNGDRLTVSIWVAGQPHDTKAV